MDTTVDEPEITVEDPQIAEAKASMFARMDELSRRFTSAKEKLDVEAHIVSHPLVAAGIALAAGLLLGSHGSGSRRHAAARASSDSAESRGLTAAAFGLIGTLLFRLAKDAVLGEATTYAKSWWEKQQAREAGASHAPETAAFFKH